MSTHAQFEQLCSLATAGLLSAEEAGLLDMHLRECEDCRRFLSDVRTLSDKIVPRVLAAPRGEIRIPEGMRERFLSRAAAQGFRMNPGAPLPVPSVPYSEPTVTTPQNQNTLPGWRDILLAWVRPFPVWQAAAVAVCVCALCFALGTRFSVSSAAGSRSAQAGPSLLASAGASSSIVHSNLQIKEQADQIRALRADRDKLVEECAELVKELAAVTREKQDAEVAAQQKVSSLVSEATRDQEMLTQQARELGNRETALQAELEALRQKQATTDAALTVQEQQTNQYAARLSALQSQSASQAEVPQNSGDEVRSLVAARNLHIIDVYDSDGEGKRQRAFGRVFYVEGRSLVFYAYDLAAAHSQKKITFHVWGERADNKETTHSLGILRDDDPHEQRWALTFDDPKVLAEINSVFVTIEPANHDVPAPTGKKVLYAFLGGKPNHP